MVSEDATATVMCWLHISSDDVFSEILKKPSIAQKKNDTSNESQAAFHWEKQNVFFENMYRDLGNQKYFDKWNCVKFVVWCLFTLIYTKVH